MKPDILKKKRSPKHPGEMLLEEFLKPRRVSQRVFAKRLGISLRELSDLIHARSGMTADLALRLSRVVGTSPQFWMNMQVSWDLWHAFHGEGGKAIAKLKPLTPIDPRPESP